MCGLVGCFDLRGEDRIDPEVIRAMAASVVHRGPDSEGAFIAPNVGFGFQRLSILDLEGGDQPLFSEDGNVVVVCNGEIYNHRELRRELEARGHVFRTRTDVEVLVHLYEERSLEMCGLLNGQFAFALLDRRRGRLFMARDPFGICPLFYTVVDGLLIFASEIKAILRHPLAHARRRVDLTGLDQVLSFPGLVSPRTLFQGVSSLPGGHHLVARDGDVRETEYWDLDYPRMADAPAPRPESYYVEALGGLFEESVKRRLQADVPVGYYLSGGLDSSMIAGMVHRLSNGERRHSFSIGFEDGRISETRFQQAMARRVGSLHREITFDWSEIAERLPAMVYHCECPVKEAYNTCSMALSGAARGAGVPVILTGEGADELFAGYVGYRFDAERRADATDLEGMLEEDARERLWGDRRVLYETDYHALRETKTALYSEGANELLDGFDALEHAPVKRERIVGRHPVHQRSYLDFKLRLSDHLVGDHGDRMALANSVEARYPFLDLPLVEFAREVPPELKLKGLSEKYILKRVAEGLVPREIVEREKYGFHAPGSPYLLRRGVEWIGDMLSYDRIRRQGFLNPDTVEALKGRYGREGFRLNLPFESDLLMIVLTFGILQDTFDLPAFN